MSEPLHDTRGIVPLFEKGSLDASEPFLASPLPNFEENLIYAQYDKRLKSYLIGALDIFRQYEIFVPESNIEDFQSLVELVQKQLIPEVEAQMAIDCNDVEDCLQTSLIINNITNDVTNIFNDVTNINNDITNINNDVTNINNDITNINESYSRNEYPPVPDVNTDPNLVCGSAWTLAEGLNDLIQDVITDALTFTWAEFVESIINALSFKFTFMKALWDFVIASANPNIASEVSASIEFVAEAIYCENLNLESAKTLITNDVRIPNDSAIAYNSAIDAMTASKLNSLIYLGSLDTSRDCSQFLSCGVSSGIVTFGVDEWQDWQVDTGTASINHGNPLPCARNSGTAPSGGAIGRCRVIIDIPRTQVNNIQLDINSLWGSNEFVFVRTYLYDGGATPVSNTEQQNTIDSAWVHQTHNHANVYADRIIVDALNSTLGVAKNYDIRLDNISWNL